MSSPIELSVPVGSMPICVKTLSNKSVTLDVEANDTIAKVKALIEKQEGIPRSQQKLVFVDKELTDDSLTLADHEIQAESTIHMVKTETDGPLFPSAQQALVPPVPVHTQEWEMLKSGKNQIMETPRKLKECVVMLQQHLQKAKPLFKQLDQFLQKALELQEQYASKYPCDEILKAAVAVVLLVAGGRFPMTLACVQSFKTWGWRTMRASWKELQEKYMSSVEILDDQDGGLFMDFTRTLKTMVVAESQSERDAAMKHSLVIAKCVDPYILSDCLKGFWAGAISVIASLRSKLAYQVCIGSRVGKNVSEAVQQWMHGRLDLPADGRQWAEVELQKACGFAAFILSFLMTHKMNALNSALQGSTVLTEILIKYLHKSKEFQDRRDSDSKMGNDYQMAKWTIAVIGFVFQVTHSTDIPFLMKVPLAPLLAPLYLTERRLASYANA